MAVYSALYRTWRPRRLADLVGQEHVERTLRNALGAGHTAHAYLFCGPRGTGKTSTARILAAALNCEHASDGDACGACQACREVASDRLIDVQEIDAASNRQVEDMRALRETVGYAPAAGRHKVYILDEVHMLTEASWNTLLKTLEEPPPATTFVLCTTDPRKVLPTVVSRCQRFDFRRLTVPEIAAQLQRVCAAEGIAAAPAALEALARRADGGLRDALSTLDQATAFVREGEITPEDVALMLGAADDAAVERLIGAARGGDAQAVFTEVERLYGEGKDMGQVLRDVLSGLRDRLVALVGDSAARPRTVGPDGGATRRPEDMRWFVSAIGTLAEMEGHMRRAEQPRLLLEVALVRLLGDMEDKGHADSMAAGPIPPPRQDGRQPRSDSPPPARLGGRAPADGPRSAQPARASQSAHTVPPVSSGPPPHAAADGSRTSEPLPTGAGLHRTAEAGGPEPGWEALLDAVRRLNVPAYWTLQGGEYRGRSGGTARVAFRYAGHVPLAEGKREIVERAWVQLTGSPVRFEFIVDGQTEASNPPAPAKPARRSERSGIEAATMEPRRTGDAAPPEPAEAQSSPNVHKAVADAAISQPAKDAARAHSGAGGQDVETLYKRALVGFQGTPLREWQT